ncbi:polysaccharide lyase family 8 super-sandwich domain-containing protein [Paenibacillus koleovorans]|uniref:polysaccharide lyase family 8 super-sandwich domain-containing protein n=1 Tax=Paenibacillus koleovorans TaxID=121608 RepID=UPI000FD96BEA|nr:polysaccharide lyase family 8 super-sandwich domain-containing protein [Paenibacillus koleovorans]
MRQGIVMNPLSKVVFLSLVVLTLTLGLVTLNWDGKLPLANLASASITDPVNLAAAAQGTVAAASSVSSDRPPSNANDGDPSSAWGPLTADKNDGEVWLSLDFGSVKAFDRVTLDFVTPSGSAALPTGYTIYRLNDSSYSGTYSDNPAKWTAITSRVLADYSASAADDVSFTKVSARKLTVVLTANPSAAIPRIEEIGVYEMTRTLSSVSVHASKSTMDDGTQTGVEVVGFMTDGGRAPLTGATLVWSSSNTAIATIASTGAALSTVTGQGPGTATITGQVTLGGVTRSAQASIIVRNPASADAYDSLREKYKYRQLGGNYDPGDSDIANTINNIESTARTHLATYHSPTVSESYLWPDILPTPGSSLPDKYIYAAEDSYNRLLSLATAYANPDTTFTPYERSQLRGIILEGMTFLNANWYNVSSQQGTQWYKFEIGVPKPILALTILMYDDLIVAGKQSLITAEMNAIKHFSPDPKDSRSATPQPRIGYMTGANLVEKCYNEALIGILKKSSGSLELARSSIYSVFDYVTSGDGFYTDGSFLQHNTVAYTGSYGLVLIDALPGYMWLVDDTAWALDDTSAAGYRDVKALYDWIRNSFEPVFHNGILMDMVRGRAISRGLLQDRDAGKSFLVSLPTIAEFAPAGEAAEFRGLVKKWAGSSLFTPFYQNISLFAATQVKSILADNSIAEWDVPNQFKPFPSMDRIVHHRPGFTFAISMYSSRISNYEYQAPPNEENKRGWYTGEGMTYLYNGDDRQYSDGYWPTIDAKRLPGITVDYTQSRSAGSGNKYESTAAWVGGTEIDGLYGAAGMQVAGWSNTLTAKKSWFMFDDEIVALGADIDNATASRTIETIVENRRLNSAGNNALVVNGTAKSTALGWTETMSGTTWAHLSGSTSNSDIGYYFPGGAAIKGLREARTGAWTGINPYHTEANLADPLTRNYLSLRYEHGTGTFSNSTYAYVLLPNKSATQVSAYASAPDITIVANNANVQAVSEANLGIFAANFWNNGTYTAGPVTSNKKASVMTRWNGSEFEVSVSDPTQLNTGTIDLEFARSVSGVIEKDSRITVLQTNPTLKLRINVNGAKGQALHAKFSPAFTIAPAADAYVRGGTFGDTNYGDITTLRISETTNDNTKRKAYLKFDLSDFASISHATLQLYGSSDAAATIQVYAVTNDAWTESGLTYNNGPAGTGSAAASFTTATTAQSYFLNLTSLAQSNLSGNGILSVVLISNTSTALTDFNSKENAASPPQLIISGVPD